MEWYVLPALVALVLNVGLLIVAAWRNWLGVVWGGFVLLLALHNVVELLVLMKPVGVLSLNALVRLYYVCSFAVMVYAVHYVVDRRSVVQCALVAVLGLLALTLSAWVLGSNAVIAGAIDLTHSVQAERGALFAVVPLFVLLAMVLVVGALVVNYCRYAAIDPHRQAQVVYTAKALLPLVAVALLVAALLNTEQPINAAVLVPLAGTLFLLIALRGRRALSEARRSVVLGGRALAASGALMAHLSNAGIAFDPYAVMRLAERAARERPLHPRAKRKLLRHQHHCNASANDD